MQKQLKDIIAAIVAVGVFACITMWVVVRMANDAEFVPRSEFTTTTVVTTTTTTTPPPAVEPSLAPNGPGTGSCVERLPDGSIVDCG